MRAGLLLGVALIICEGGAETTVAVVVNGYTWKSPGLAAGSLTHFRSLGSGSSLHTSPSLYTRSGTESELE